MMIYNDDDNDGKVLFGKYKFQFLMIRTTTTTAEKKDELKKIIFVNLVNR